VRLTVPTEGIRAGDVILCFPTLEHVDALLPAFTDPELREAGNLPAFDRDALKASIQDLPTTTIARLLSQHAFALGIERVAAYVNLGNVPSERVVGARRALPAKALCARCPSPMADGSTRRSTRYSRANDVTKRVSASGQFASRRR
jgi:hypothetical protein